MRKTRPLSMKKSSTSERMNELIDPPTKRNSFFRINKNPKKNVSLTQRAFTSQGILRNKEKTTERTSNYQRPRTSRKKKKGYQFNHDTHNIDQIFKFVKDNDFKEQAVEQLRFIFGMVQQQVSLRLNILKTKQKIVLMQDKKRLELFNRKKKKFEEVYGIKKKDLLFNGEDYDLLNVYSRLRDWKKVCFGIKNVRKTMYSHFELDFFIKSLTYSEKIFNKEKHLTRNSIVPQLLNFRKTTIVNSELYVYYSMNNHALTHRIDLEKHIKYSVEVENLAQIILLNLAKLCERSERIFNKHFKDTGINRINSFKEHFFELIEWWRMSFLQNLSLSEFSQEQIYIKQLTKYLHQRIDFQLLDLRQAVVYFNCYLEKKNIEKGYLILSSAFENNKEGIDLFLDLIIKYKSEKTLMTHFLNPNELCSIPMPKWKVQSIFHWIDSFKDKSQRNPYIDMLIQDLKDIIFQLASNAMITNHFHQAERYYEILLYTYDNIDKLKLFEGQYIKKQDLNMKRNEENYTKKDNNSHISDKTKPRISKAAASQQRKNRRVIQILKLNMRYVTINNELINITNKNHNFEKCLNYIANNYFLFHNSVEMINDTDPLKYPKKNMDVAILKNKKAYTDTQAVKKEFMKFLSFFNREFKRTLQYYQELWMSVNKKFSLVSNNLYNAIKNCLETLKKLSNYSRAKLHEFIKKYDSSVPSLEEVTGPTPSYWMETYFPRYTGIVDIHEFEVRVITKLNYTGWVQTAPSEDDRLKPTKRYQKDTRSSRNKKDRRLNKQDVNNYFHINSEHPKIIDILLSKVLFQSYKNSCSYDTKHNYVNIYNSKPLDKDGFQILDKELDSNNQFLYRKIQDFKQKFKLRYDKQREKKNSRKRKRDPRLKLFLQRRMKPFFTNEKINIITFLQKKKNFLKESKPSQFCKEFKLDVTEVQKKYGLYEFDSRTNHSKISLIAARRNSMDANDNILKITHRDKYNLSGLRSEHYFNLALIRKREEEKNRVRIMLRGKKEEGDYVHIEDSIIKINETKFTLFNNIDNKKFFTETRVFLTHHDMKVRFDFFPKQRFKSFSTELKMKLPDHLNVCKEQIIKMSHVKFQSYWPILHRLFGELKFKQIIKDFPTDSQYFDEKSDGVHYNILDSMAFAFPIILTKLKTYPQEIVQKFNLIYFEKYDLDAVQCIQILLPSIMLSNLKHTMPQSIDFDGLVDSLVEDKNQYWFQSYIINNRIQRHRYELKKRRRLQLVNLNDHLRMKCEDKLVHCENQKELFTIDKIILYIDHLEQSILMAKELIQFSEQKNDSNSNKYIHQAFCSRQILRMNNGKHLSVDLNVEINIENLKELKDIIKLSYKRYITMKNVTNCDFEEKEFLILLWFFAAEKIFGFSVNPTNYTKLRFNFIKKHKSSLSKNIFPDKIWTLIEMPKMDRVSSKEYISFTQFYWLSTKRSKILRFSNPFEISKWLGVLSLEFDNFDVYKEIKEGWAQITSFLDEIFCNPFFHQKILKTWVNIDKMLPIWEFLYEKSISHEVFESDDGQIIHSTIKPIYSFDYSAFHKAFNHTPEKTIKYLENRLIGSLQHDGFKVEYLTSLLKIIELFEVKKEVKKPRKANKRLKIIDDVMLRVKSSIQLNEIQSKDLMEVPMNSLNKSSKFMEIRSSVNSRENLFSRNFKQLNSQKYRIDTQHSALSVFQKEALDLNMTHKILILTNKYNFQRSNVRMMEHKEDFYNGNIIQGQKYTKKINEFRKQVWDENIDFSIDYNSLLVQALSQIVFRNDQMVYSFKDQVRIDLQKQPKYSQKQTHLFKYPELIEAGNSIIKYRVWIKVLPYESLQRFILFSKIELSINFPLIQRTSSLLLKEPCIILKFLRLVSLKSSRLAQMELNYLISRLVSNNLPRNQVYNIDKNINSQYRNESDLFSVPVIELISPQLLDSDLSMSNLSRKIVIDVENIETNGQTNTWVKT